MTERLVPMFPLGSVIFPFQSTGLYVFEERYQQLLRDVASSDQFGTCLISRGSEVGGGDERTSFGTMLRLVASQQLPTGETLIVVEGQECFRIMRWVPDNPYPQAVIDERCCDEVAIEPELLALAKSSVRAVRTLQSEVETDVTLESACDISDNPWQAAWQLCALTPMATLDQFKILSLSNPNERLRLLVEICCERYGDFQRMLALDEPPSF